MKSGPEIVKAGLRSFFESAADDIEKMVENLKLGKVSKGNQVSSKAKLYFSKANNIFANWAYSFQSK